MRHRTTALFALAVLSLLATGRPASADRASASAALPADDGNPFLTIVKFPSRTAKFDDLVRKPEFVVYASGQFLIQKTDDRLYRGVLTKDETLDLLDFLLNDAKVPTLSLNYLIAMPFPEITEFTLRTRGGSWTLRMRSSIGLGSGVADATAALKRVDQRRFALGDRADQPYKPGVLLVVTRRVDPQASTPLWGWSAALPFAAFSAASDVDRTMGAIVDGPRAEAVRDAIAQGRFWRFGADAIEIEARPALPHELALPRFGSTSETGPTPPTTAPPAVPIPAPLPDPTPAPPLPPEPPSTPTPPVAGTPPSTAAASDWKDDDVDFAGVQTIIRNLKKKASGSPHGVFWEKPYDKFVGLTFDIPDPQGKVALLVKGNGAGSNLIHALKGEALQIQTADGKTVEKAFDVMPPGKPMPPADIERIRRWIDHGAPEKRPAGGAPAETPEKPVGPAPEAPTKPEPPKETATPTGPGIPLYLVGEGTLGLRVQGDGPDADPAFYVARNESEWKSIFDTALPQHGGANGKTIAERLKPYRDGALGYDYGGSQLVLIVSPVSKDPVWSVAPTVATLSDGSGRITVAAAKPNPDQELTPPQSFRWAIYRSASNLPASMTLLAPSGRTIAASSAK